MAYRRVESRIWNDEKFRELSDDGKLVFMFLLTHPHMTSVGAMRATSEGLAAELKWPVQRFANGFETVLEARMAEFDSTACMVALPNFLKHNPPSNPNMVKGWVYALELLPECALKQTVMNRCANRIETNASWVREGLAEPFRNTEQEQETEPKQEKSSLPTVPTQASLSEKPTALNEATGRGMRLAASLGVDEVSEAMYASFPTPWLAWAMEERPDIDARRTWAMFVDHWKAKPGSKGVGLDWQGTWRNWVRKENPGKGAPAVGKQAALEQRNAEAAASWRPPEELAR